MPCFKGLAVSIHTPEGPLPEFSIQRQSRYSRITSYIPVPPAKVPVGSTTNKPEQSTFAISITLLTPNLSVPYSTPKPTEDDPYPRPKLVGELPGYGGDRGQYGGVVGPYIPLTASAHETIAAYIYFDGRAKEEVATLLRRGEETWVNSRWVSVPEEEGGGLAEREFLFREVGLERWLNGLDLDGKDVAAKMERRRVRTEKRRRRRKELKEAEAETAEMDMDAAGGGGAKEDRVKMEKLSDDSDMAFSSDEDSDEEPPLPEAAGQIKVALFRVLASGEIKRGEYSPQFDAHDDDDESEAGRAKSGGTTGDEAEADIDHTTSFAKPKTLDPKSISTQTVTGIDGPEKPYAVFTFLYRGEKQLQKMGILPTPAAEEKPAATPSKRRSVPTDFSRLGPLKAGGTVGFSSFRDNETSPQKSHGKEVKKGGDSDDDDDESAVNTRVEADDIANVAEKEPNKELLTADDARREEGLAEGFRKIKLKRVHSAEPLNEASPRKSPASASPATGHTPPQASESVFSPPSFTANNGTPSSSQRKTQPQTPDDAIVGSPMKKSRPSLPGPDDDTLHKRLGLGVPGGIGDVLGRIEKAETGPVASKPEGEAKGGGGNADEEL
ncbi:MAG: hypothetical protein M1832_005426 [Thelocarpon impressellum]|nr:MAG: hypothetical protein M1832_005426 [Thelocarpon impressellum]